MEEKIKLRRGMWIKLIDPTKEALADMSVCSQEIIFSRARQIEHVKYGDEVLLDHDEIHYLISNLGNVRLATAQEIKAAKIWEKFQVRS